MTTKVKSILFILILMTLVFFYGAFFYQTPFQPTGLSLEAPSKAHLLGTDNLGIDIFAQISRGYFLSMFVGLMAAFFSFIIAGILGITAGYYGGKTDLIISFITNIFLSVPQLPIMILIGAFFGQHIGNIIVIITLFSWAPIAKIIQAKTILLCNTGYMRMAKFYGANFLYIFKTHMLPDLLPLLLVNSMFVIGKAIIQEASLAFLGLSDPTSKSWGLMLNYAISFPGIYFTDFWLWWILPPLICLVSTIFCIRFIARELEYTLLC